MPKEIIVDTSALIAFFVKSETNHLIAKHYVLSHSYYRWIILDTIFDETVTWIRSKICINASIQIGKVLRTEHHYINISPQEDYLIWETFCRYNDKKWSYTDCSILVMANCLNIFEVFAFDEHIRQMAGNGITCVP